MGKEEAHSSHTVLYWLLPPLYTCAQAETRNRNRAETEQVSKCRPNYTVSLKSPHRIPAPAQFIIALTTLAVEQFQSLTRPPHHRQTSN